MTVSQLIEYFRLNIEYLRNSFNFKKTYQNNDEANPVKARHKYSIFNSQFRLGRVRDMMELPFISLCPGISEHRAWALCLAGNVL